MKKVFTLVVMIVTPTMAFAQGQVTFNCNAGGVKQWTSATDLTLINSPKGNVMVELISAPVGTALSSPNVNEYATLAGFLAANPGWAPGTALAGGSNPGGLAVNGIFALGNLSLNVPGGANAQYFVIGWTGPNEGPLGTATSYDAAMAFGNCCFAQSAIFTTRTGDPNATPPELPVSTKTTFGGITFECGWPDYYFRGFTAQPTSQTVLQGATATFWVGADAYPPPYYQWYFNGVSIPGAYGSSLQVSNAQLTNAGTYWVVLSNPAWSGCPCGSVYVSASATLTVLEPPIFTHPPQDQTAYAGSTVSFRASAAGSQPLAYQWFFNASAILGVGTTRLQLTNVQPAQAGAYTVVITNVTGAVTSAPAMLSVIPPVEWRMVTALALQGQPGSILHLENADTLGLSPAWVTFDSVTLTNTWQWYFDVSTPLPPQRFYRAWQANGPSVIPALDLKRVPALTLTGSVGSSVRADYINQFGPTDAWVALDTVMLTNTSQLYFDVSAPGQPPRVYRLVQVP
jgi:Immunoglobulin domain